jgi:hypothetical protein
LEIHALPALAERRYRNFAEIALKVKVLPDAPAGLHFLSPCNLKTACTAYGILME